MSFFITFKKLPWAIAFRVLTLTVILLVNFLNLLWLPNQIHRLRHSGIEGLTLEFTRDSGNVTVNSAIIERMNLSGEATVTFADRDANKSGIYAGSIVLNSEALTSGPIGTTVTLFVKSGGDKREVNLTRRQYNNPLNILSFFSRISPLVQMYIEIIILCAAILLTMLFSIVAFWYQSDEWLAFFTTGAIMNFFAPIQQSPPSYLLVSYFITGAILFLILFPKGKVKPKWSWLLVLLPVPHLIKIIYQVYVYEFPLFIDDKLIYFLESAMPTLVLIIFGAITYWCRNSLTLIERKRINWLILGLFLVFTFRFIWTLPSVARLIPDQGANYTQYNLNLYKLIIFRLNRTIYAIYRSLTSLETASVLIIFGYLIYKYIHLVSPLEKQQMKWMALGLIVGEIPIIVAYMFLAFFFNRLQIDWEHASLMLSDTNRGDYLNLVTAGIDKLLLVEMFLIGLSIVAAKKHYRLWDVDTFINHALVKGGLTILAGLLITITATFIDQTQGRAAFNQNALLFIPISILLIAATYKPSKAWLQNRADNFIPLEKINFKETYLEFTTDVHEFFTQRELSKILVEKSIKQMKVTHASVFLKNKNGKLQHIKTASTGKKVIKPVIHTQTHSKLRMGEVVTSDASFGHSIIIPLLVPHGQNSDLIGALLLGPRITETGYSSEMKDCLRKLGEEIGTSFYLSQVKRQRQRLKTPRQTHPKSASHKKSTQR